MKNQVQLFTMQPVSSCFRRKLMRNLCLFAVIIAFVACGGGNDDPPAKSNACDITSFKVGNDAWQISGTNITFVYPKGTTEGNLTPSIITSEKATVKPESNVAQNFFTTTGVSYTVTAEDGKTTKTYTAKATISTTK